MMNRFQRHDYVGALLQRVYCYSSVEHLKHMAPVDCLQYDAIIWQHDLPLVRRSSGAYL